MTEAWATDDLLASAVRRYAARIAGFVLPAAYSLGRIDGDVVKLGHVNRVGAVRPLPAVILASVCGYVDSSGAFSLSHDDLAEVIRRLTPAEAATHMPHPNLWTWRQLLSDARPASTFCAYFLADAADQLDGPGADEFVRRATTREPQVTPEGDNRVSDH